LFSSGKNNGSVQGVQYFECGAKSGLFVRPDKLLQDKRNVSRAANNHVNNTNSMKRSLSRGKYPKSVKVLHQK
jgi:kinesin family protein 13